MALDLDPRLSVSNVHQVYRVHKALSAMQTEAYGLRDGLRYVFCVPGDGTLYELEKVLDEIADLIEPLRQLETIAESKAMMAE